MEQNILDLFPAASTDLIRFNLYLSIGFVGVTLGIFSIILFSRWRDGVRYARRRKVEQDIQGFLTSYLFDDQTDKEAILVFTEQFTQKRVQRHIVLENLVSLHKNLIGESADKLRNLYCQSGLESYSRQKLYASSWHEIAQGINELANMGVRKYSELIRAFINHPHPTLRSEAQVALLKLETNAPFSFLDDLREPLLDWQQLQLARATSKSKFLSIPNFERWLGKSEESIVIFCLRMIASYGQHSAADGILSLLQHPAAKIREEAIITLRQLNTHEAVPSLINMFTNESTDIQLEILKAVPAIGDQQSIPFFEQVLGFENRRLQLAAARALCQSGQEGQNKVLAIKNDPEHALQQLAATALSYKA
ncbi:HEAT repeat domain-containing protein [Pontibacter sp. JH31]|uniref:HEAT repeat domain-containing protein n=1 Tax=Pontibacter aquaedesilientis TaxID=2766980 RepID=A0ABR7XBE5_9BACT|nr:HEAT repeat domain-containing protein [Pontibacter aquaedesilientis]MBD1395634.1 HEAT repeat domain-containing protein [Pontibacter aquaedesilientis]